MILCEHGRRVRNALVQIRINAPEEGMGHVIYIFYNVRERERTHVEVNFWCIYSQSLCNCSCFSTQQDGQMTLGDTSKIYTDGCLKALRVWVDSNMLILGGVMAGILVPQVRLLQHDFLQDKKSSRPSLALAIMSHFKTEYNFCYLAHHLWIFLR